MKNLLQCRSGGKAGKASQGGKRPEEFCTPNIAEEARCACISAEVHAVSVTFWELSWRLGLTFCDLTAALSCAHLDANKGKTKSAQMSLNASHERRRAAGQQGPIIRQRQGDGKRLSTTDAFKKTNDKSSSNKRVVGVILRRLLRQLQACLNGRHPAVTD